MGSAALSASQDSTLKLWDITTGACLRTFKGHREEVNSVAVLPDGQHALSASEDRTLKLWDLTTGACLRTYHEVGNSFALLPNGQHILSASRGQTLKLWNIATGNCLLTLYGDSAFCCCAISTDGRTVVAGDGTGGVYFLRLEGLA